MGRIRRTIVALTLATAAAMAVAGPAVAGMATTPLIAKHLKLAGRMRG